MSRTASASEADKQRGIALAFRARTFTRPYVPILKTQKVSRADRGGTKGLPFWIAKTVLPPPPEPDLEALLWHVVRDLSRGDEVIDPPQGYWDGMFAEWIGCKASTTQLDKAAERELDDAHIYQWLCKDTPETGVVMYLHGGGYYSGGPSTSRHLTTALATHSKSRIFAISHRLAPQAVFPSHLLDVLVAYFSLCSPPPSALRAAVRPESIVLAGESAGATILLGLVQVLLHLQRNAASYSELRASDDGFPVFRFNGRDVPIRLPAGVAILSPNSEPMLALPSYERNSPFDWLTGGAPYFRPGFPADEIWPSNPPRAEIFAHASAILHPLVTLPLVEDWRGACPLWIALGDETPADGTGMIATQAYRDGVAVNVSRWEGMPHVWPFFRIPVPQTDEVMRKWGLWIRARLDGREASSDATVVRLGAMQIESVDWRNLVSVTRDEANILMRKAQVIRETQIWRGPTEPVGNPNAKVATKL